MVPLPRQETLKHLTNRSFIIVADGGRHRWPRPFCSNTQKWLPSLRDTRGSFNFKPTRTRVPQERVPLPIVAKRIMVGVLERSSGGNWLRGIWWSPRRSDPFSRYEHSLANLANGMSRLTFAPVRFKLLDYKLDQFRTSANLYETYHFKNIPDEKQRKEDIVQ